MSKPPFVPTPFPGPQQNATTVGPSFAYTISSRSELFEITAATVLKRDEKGLHAELYRRSTTEPGYFSLDLYDRDGAKWVYAGEAKGKFTQPVIPANAHREQINGHDFYTVEVLSVEDRVVLRELAQSVSRGK